jgi:hypothetical protein
MIPDNLISFSVGTISISVIIVHLVKFLIERYFAFKEKGYESKLNEKLKEFETKLTHILPERIVIIKNIYKLIIVLEGNTWRYVNQIGDESKVTDALDNLKNEYSLNEFYFSNNQRQLIKNIIKEFVSCWADFVTYEHYGSWNDLPIDLKREKAEFSKSARKSLDNEIPRIKEDLIREIQSYYLIVN